MKNIVFFFFLTACVSAKVYEKRLEDQRLQIIQLQEARKKQEDTYKRNIKKLIFRISRTKTEKPPEETKPKMVCIEDDGEDVCFTFDN